MKKRSEFVALNKGDNAIFRRGFVFLYEKNDSGKVYAQIPGMISEIYVKKGDNVNINDKLFILEAMKMENEIASSVKGTIKEILVKPGISVEKGSLIMEIQN